MVHMKPSNGDFIWIIRLQNNTLVQTILLIKFSMPSEYLHNLWTVLKKWELGHENG